MIDPLPADELGWRGAAGADVVAGRVVLRTCGGGAGGPPVSTGLLRVDGFLDDVVATVSVAVEVSFSSPKAPKTKPNTSTQTKPIMPKTIA